MIQSGFWTVGQFAGAPIRIHWSVIVLMIYFGGLEPAAWVGIVAVVLIHELGHAFVVRRVGAQVTEVMVYGFGGYCGWRGYASSRKEALIAWGGVAAQALLYVAATLYASAGPPRSSTEMILLYTFTSSNLSLIVLNLLPIEPLDGAKAWKLVPILWADLQRAWSSRKTPPPAPPRAEPRDAPPSPSSAPRAKVVRLAERPEPPEGEAPDPNSNRVQDPATAERMFQQVYKGLLDVEPGSSEPPDDPKNRRDPEDR